MKKKIRLFIFILMIAIVLPSIGVVNDSKNPEIAGQYVSFSTLSSGSTINLGNVNYLQPSRVEWNKTYGGSEEDWLYFVSETKDGGFIASGFTVNYAWLLKVNQSGMEEWNATTSIDINGGYWATYVEQTNDGGYMICGSQGSLIHPGDGFLWKTDSMGITEWIRTYPYDYLEYGSIYCVQLTNDGGYIAVGNTKVDQSSDYDALLFKTDSMGVVEWREVFTKGEGRDSFQSIRMTIDGGYIIGGFTTMNGSMDYWVVKTDSGGNLEWDRTFGGIGDDYATSRNCLQTGDGGYIINGITDSYGAGKDDQWVVKIDTLGNIQWTETYGEKKVDRCCSMDITDDGGYVFCLTKNYNDFVEPRGDIWIIKTDDAGNIQWSQTFGGSSEDRGYYVGRTSDGGYIIAGRTESFGAGEEDGWLIKLSPDTEMVTPELQVQKPKPKRIYLWDIIGLPFPFTQNALVLGDLTFSVNANDPSGISKVEFFIDNIVVDESAEPPYNHMWTGAEKGTCILKIRAYNNYGGTSKEVVTIRKVL